jgi:two-component system response regulator WspF
MRIAIVNDLAMAVEVLRRIVTSAPGCSVAWTAADGAEAVEKCAADRPDLILMDLIMPVMDGAQATAAIMTQSPCAILVVTASVRQNTAKVFEAMGHGALDAVCTPAFSSGGYIDGAGELLKKIATIGKLIHAAPRTLQSFAHAAVIGRSPLLAIGSSTGGPKALLSLLSCLPPPLDVPVVVVQHLDAEFAAGLADWLSGQTGHRVETVREGARPAPGIVHIAATNDHLVLAADGALRYTPEPADYPYRPSVDEFFATVASRWPSPGVAVLLTGMGRDGARGLLALRNSGWHTIAQDEQTSVVYGMPKAAMDLGAAVEQLPLHEIGTAVMLKLEHRNLNL